MFDKTDARDVPADCSTSTSWARSTVTQAALPYIPTDGTGRIINVTSAAGLTGTLGQVNYSAAKAGIIGFTKSLARELATKNIMVNALAPLAATPMTETIRTNEKFAANMMNAHPDEAVGRTVGGRGGVRVHGVRCGVLHHRPGAAGRRRHGDVTAHPMTIGAPLAGITVVAMEQAVAAPMCTRVLADFGARMIKVENPNGGDFARDYDDVVNGPGGLAAHFVWCNRGKESVTLNLKSPAGMDILHRLLDRADAFVSNLAPGSTARLGLSPADLAVDHPNVIPVEIDGYGPGGPISHKRAYDLLVQAEGRVVRRHRVPGHARQARPSRGGLHHRALRRAVDPRAAVLP